MFAWYHQFLPPTSPMGRQPYRTDEHESWMNWLLQSLSSILSPVAGCASVCNLAKKKHTHTHRGDQHKSLRRLPSPLHHATTMRIIIDDTCRPCPSRFPAPAATSLEWRTRHAAVRRDSPSLLSCQVRRLPAIWRQQPGTPVCICKQRGSWSG